MLKRNVLLGKAKKLSAWRKMSLGTWRPTSDSSIYSIIELDVGPVKNFLAQINGQEKTPIKLSHFVGRVCANMLTEFPELNSIIRFGKIYPRQNVDIFFHVAADTNGDDLSGMVVRQANQKSFSEIAGELKDRAYEIRTGKDKTFEKSKKSIGLLPGILMKQVLDFLGFFLFSLNLWTPLIGSPRDPFGSMMISNIGALGAGMAIVPIAAYSRVPLILSMGSVKKAPVIRDNNIEIGEVITLCFTFDHRIVDGVVAAKMENHLRHAFSHPNSVI